MSTSTPFPAIQPNPHLSAQLHRTVSKSPHDKLVAATRKWVAQSFFEPVLREARKNPFHSNRFSGGKAADSFGAMQDEFMAEKMTRGTGSKLVNSIVRHIEAKAAYGRNSSSRIIEEREGADRMSVTAAAARSITSGSRHVATAH